MIRWWCIEKALGLVNHSCKDDRTDKGVRVIIEYIVVYPRGCDAVMAVLADIIAVLPAVCLTILPCFPRIAINCTGPKPRTKRNYKNASPVNRHVTK